MTASDALERAVADTRDWLERAVIGLNLCPFAKPVFAQDRIRFAATATHDAAELRAVLEDELRALAAADPGVVETTLLVAPHAFPDFLDFNDFLDEADVALDALGLVGAIQIASFHPRYRFAGTAEDDVTNCTNRAPHPTLHLLREASVERAAAAYREPASIYERNIETMRRLGIEGWMRLRAGR
jgi:uncharacterized protein